MLRLRLIVKEIDVVVVVTRSEGDRLSPRVDHSIRLEFKFHLWRNKLVEKSSHINSYVTIRESDEVRQAKSKTK